MKSEIYFVTGTAGVGKTTVMYKLTKRGVSTIGIDEEPGLTAWIHKETGEMVKPGVELTADFLKSHDWGCNISLLQKLIEDSKKPVVVCGICSNANEVINLCKKTFVLVCEPEVFLSRIQKRTDNEYGKTKVAQQEILGYYKACRNKCLNLGAVKIDAEQPIDVVVKKILEQVTPI